MVLLRRPAVFAQQGFQRHDGLLAPRTVIGNRDKRVRDRTLRPVQEIASISQEHVQTGKGGRLVPIFECLRLGNGDSEQRGLSKRIRFFGIRCLLWTIQRAFQQFGAQQWARLIAACPHHALVNRDDIEEREIIPHLTAGEMPVDVRVLVQTFVQQAFPPWRKARVDIGSTHRYEDKVSLLDALRCYFLIRDRDDKSPIRLAEPLWSLKTVACPLLHRYHHMPAFSVAYIAYTRYIAYSILSNSGEDSERKMEGAGIMADEHVTIVTLLQDLVRIDSVNPSLVPGTAGEVHIAAELNPYFFFSSLLGALPDALWADFVVQPFLR